MNKIKCIIGLAFTVDVTSHLNNLNLKLLEKDKLIPRLVNDISAIKNQFFSQVISEDLRQFLQLREQS